MQTIVAVLIILLMFLIRDLVIRYLERLEYLDEIKREIDRDNSVDIIKASHELAEIDKINYNPSVPSNSDYNIEMEDYFQKRVDYYSEILTNLKFKEKFT